MSNWLSKAVLGAPGLSLSLADDARRVLGDDDEADGFVKRLEQARMSSKSRLPSGAVIKARRGRKSDRDLSYWLTDIAADMQPMTAEEKRKLREEFEAEQAADFRARWGRMISPSEPPKR